MASVGAQAFGGAPSKCDCGRDRTESWRLKPQLRCLSVIERVEPQIFGGARSPNCTTVIKAWSATKATVAISKSKQAATLSSMKNKPKFSNCRRRVKHYSLTRSPERRRHITSASRPRDANRKGTRKARQRWLGVGHFHGDFQAFRDANIFCEACGEFSVFHYVALEWR